MEQLLYNLLLNDKPTLLCNITINTLPITKYMLYRLYGSYTVITLNIYSKKGTNVCIYITLL